MTTSVERLKKAATPASFSARFSRSAMVGVVTQGNVWLKRPGWGSKNGPARMCFSGEFRQTENGVLLVGRFSVSLLYKVATSLSCIFLFGMTFAIFSHAWKRADASWPYALIPLTTLTIGLSSTVWNQHFRNNSPGLSRSIQRVLSSALELG